MTVRKLTGLAMLTEMQCRRRKLPVLCADRGAGRLYARIGRNLRRQPQAIADCRRDRLLNLTAGGYMARLIGDVDEAEADPQALAEHVFLALVGAEFPG
jgi:hypothetical protein